jgi:PAS domain S-box-containing protein
MVNAIRNFIRRFSLRAKLSLLNTLLIGGITGFIFVYVPSQQEQQALNAMSAKANNFARILANSISSSIVFGDTATAAEDLINVTLDEDNVYLMVTDVSKKVFFAHNKSIAEKLDYTSSMTSSHITPDGLVFQTSAPALHNNREVGRLYLGISLRSLREDVTTSKITLAAISVILFLIGMAATFGISTYLTRPLRLMVTTAEQIAEGDISHRAPIQSKDEVGQFAQSFNTMVEKLESAQIALEEINLSLEQRVKERTRELELEIAERLKTEQALQQSETRKKGILEALPDLLFILSHDGTLIESRVKDPRDLALSPEKIVGSNIRDIGFSEETQEVVIRNIRKTLETGQPQTFMFDLTVLRGNRMWEARMVKLNEEEVLALVRDITDRIELEEQFRQAQKMESIGTLAGGIAHDFNNILGIIIGYASMMTRDKTIEEKNIKNLKNILKAAQRGAGLVKQLLTFARKTNIVFESVNANNVILELTKLLSETFPKTVTFSLHLDHDIPAITADSNQIHQALLNLAVNARDAMPNGGTLSFASSLVERETLLNKFPDAKDEQYVVISLSDTGTGIDELTLSRIFEPFFTTKEIGKGTGLGLSVVYGVVESHRGFVDVQSEVEKGTTFSLYFPVPIVKQEIQDIADNGTSTPAQGNEVILLIEDEEMLLDLVKSMLVQHGYTVLTATNGDGALQLFQQQHSKIDIVLSDIGLPKLGGWELYTLMKEINPHVKIIFASGFVEPQIQEKMIRAGVQSFIQKPYAPDEVLASIRRALDDSNKNS